MLPAGVAESLIGVLNAKQAVPRRHIKVKAAKIGFVLGVVTEGGLPTVHRINLRVKNSHS
jgi:hypothetical protein